MDDSSVGRSVEPTSPPEARPWRADSGTPPPTVTTWPEGTQPTMYVRVRGEVWVFSIVRARMDWADGRTSYQISIVMPGETSAVTRNYWWDPAWLRPAGAPRAPGRTGVQHDRPGMPHRGRT